jgi:hypothetical protein
MAHWGGPVKLIDNSRATPYILLKSSERQQILSILNKNFSNEDLQNLLEFLRDREIVDIRFEE